MIKGKTKSAKSALSSAVENTRRAELFPVFQTLLIAETVVYFLWWFVVRATYPNSYNPLSTRLIVVGYSGLIYALSRYSAFVKKHIEFLFYSSLYVLTLQNFYLKSVNYDNVVWPVSTYITVLAMCSCFHSLPALAWYCGFVLVTGTYIAYLHHFAYPFYIPGLATLLFISYLAFYHRAMILQRLIEANTKFYELFNSAFEGMCLHREGAIVDVNESFQRITGYSKEELLGMRVERLAATDFHRQYLLDRARSAEPLLYELAIRSKSGEVVPVEISSQAHRWEGRQIRLVAMRTIRERLEAEAQRLKVIKTEAEVRLRDEFISIASHELKTPLTPLRLTNDLLLRATIDNKILDYPYAKLRRMFELNKNQINRLCLLIDDMLDVSRMNQRAINLRFERFDLRELIEEIIFSFSQQLEANKIKLRVYMPESIYATLDRHRIEQVLTNLIKNSCIYAPRHPLLLLVKKKGDRIVIALRDHGPGIAPQDQKRIFGRFERAVSSRNYGGMGLGLYITEQIVTAHHGSIRVESKAGRGATFVVDLPVEPVPLPDLHA